MALELNLKFRKGLKKLGLVTITFPEKPPKGYDPTDLGGFILQGDKRKIWLLKGHNPKEIPWTTVHEINHIVITAWLQEYFPELEVPVEVEEALASGLEEADMALATQHPDLWPKAIGYEDEGYHPGRIKRKQSKKI